MITVSLNEKTKKRNREIEKTWIWWTRDSNKSNNNAYSRPKKWKDNDMRR